MHMSLCVHLDVYAFALMYLTWYEKEDCLKKKKNMGSSFFALCVDVCICARVDHQCESMWACMHMSLCVHIDVCAFALM